VGSFVISPAGTRYLARDHAPDNGARRAPRAFKDEEKVLTDRESHTGIAS